MKYVKGFYILIFLFTLNQINAYAPCYVSELESYQTHFHQEKKVTTCMIHMIEQMRGRKDITDVCIINGNNLHNISALQDINGTRWFTHDSFWDNQFSAMDGYIIRSKDFQELEKTLRFVTASIFWNSRAKLVIKIDNFNARLQNVTNLLLHYNIIYGVSVLRQTEDDVEIYTFTSETDSCCRPKTLALLTRCSGINNAIKIFPKRKVVLSQGCTMKVITHNDWPFINFDPSVAMGFDQYVLQEFQSYKQITVEVEEFAQIDRFEKVIRNFTYTTMLLKVRNNEFEAAVGGYTLFGILAKGFSYSYPIIVDDMVLIVHRPDLLSMWEAFFKYGYTMPFMTFCFFVMICVASVFMSIFTRKEKDVVRDILIVFGYFVGNTYVKRIKSGASSAILFTTMLFLVFLTSYIMQGYLVSVSSNLVLPFEIEKTEEVYAKFKAVLHEDKSSHIVREHFHYCTTIFECLSSVAYIKEHLFTMVSTAHYDSYTWKLVDVHCDLLLTKIRDPVIMMPRTVYFRKGSVFVTEFDDFFVRFLGSGLLELYKNKLIHKQRIKCKSVDKEIQRPLKINDLFGVFLLLFVGYCLSAAAFVYEHLHKHIFSIKKLHV